MKHYKLNAQERAATGYTDKIVVTWEDLTETAANTAQTIALMSVEVGDVVHSAAYRLVDGFEDASDNALNTTTLIVGDGGDTDRFIVSKELNENGSEVDNWATAQVTDSLPYAYLAADTVDAVFGSMAAKALNDIDTGEVHIFLGIAKTASV